MKYKNKKINIKRLSISLSILIILLVLTTRISLKHAAGNFNDEENTVKESPILEKNEKEIMEKEQLKDMQIEKEDISKNEKKKESLEIEKKDEAPKKDEGPSEYNELFQNDLFLGDSITDSLSFYELIDESNVIAKLGFTTKKALEETDKIINKNPNNIYILFGMNDILSFKDKEKFIIYYKDLINTIHSGLPEAKIYVQSILPVSSEVEGKKPFLNNENIDIFNQALRDMAAEENIEYLNIREILENNMDLLEPDGIHVKYNFYELWLDYLTKNSK